MATRAGLQWAPLLTTLPSSLLNRVPACQSCHIVSLPQVSPGWGNSSFVHPLCNRGKGDQPWILSVDFPSPGLALGGAISQDAGQLQVTRFTTAPGISGGCLFGSCHISHPPPVYAFPCMHVHTCPRIHTWHLEYRAC